MKKDELRRTLESIGVRPSRGHGQNFLIDENLAQAIARDGLPDEARGDVALEVGPGPGLLTVHLAPRCRHVLAVEIDAKLAALCSELLGPASNVTLLQADALADKNHLNPAVLEALRPLLVDGARLRVCANLPYSVATPLVVGLLAQPLPLAAMTVMVQLEAAERFAAAPGDEAYGAVSVLCRAACDEVKLVRRVPPDVFWPRPKVQSAVVRFVPREGRQEGFDVLSDVVRALFNYRRKTVARAAREVAARSPDLAWLDGAVERAGISPELRPEALDVEAFRRLASQRPNI